MNLLQSININLQNELSAQAPFKEEKRQREVVLSKAKRFVSFVKH
jgi:hypothetical protein